MSTSSGITSMCGITHVSKFLSGTKPHSPRKVLLRIFLKFPSFFLIFTQTFLICAFILTLRMGKLPLIPVYLGTNQTSHISGCTREIMEELHCHPTLLPHQVRTKNYFKKTWCFWQIFGSPIHFSPSVPHIFFSGATMPCTPYRIWYTHFMNR